MDNILNYLYDIFNDNISKIETWFSQKYNGKIPNLYTSVDIRNSGHKIAPVDTNIFPAGFNNLTDDQIIEAKKFFNEYISTNFSNIKNILLITENHTRNLFYLDNIYALSNIFNDYNLTLSNLIFENKEILESKSGHKLNYEPLKKEDGFFYNTNGEKFDLIILNNDLSSGLPKILQNLDIPIIPNPMHGWFKRSKFEHFNIYTKLAIEFAEHLNFDYQRIITKVDFCGCINFKEKSGLDCLNERAQELFEYLETKYKKYNIPYNPFLFVKADNGTYGMGIMILEKPDDIYNLNKDARKKMAVIKEGVENTTVIIQEGVPTITKYNDFPAEPMVYMVAAKPVATFLRVNSAQTHTGNLNSQGMFFVPKSLNSKEELVFSTIARLASLAIVYEIS